MPGNNLEKRKEKKNLHWNYPTREERTYNVSILARWINKVVITGFDVSEVLLQDPGHAAPALFNVSLYSARKHKITITPETTSLEITEKRSMKGRNDLLYKYLPKDEFQ